MKTLIDQSGLFVESDHVSLSYSLCMRDGLLIDADTGAKHKLHTKAVKALNWLNPYLTFEEWFELMEQLNITREEIEEVVLFLNSIAGVKVQRSFEGHIQCLKWKAIQLLKGVRPITLNRRRPANFVNICVLITIAMTPIFMMAVLTGILAYGANFAPSFIVINCVSFLFVIWLGTAIHEFVHVKTVKQHLNPIIMQKGLRVGILHRHLTSRVEYKSAIFGPLAGAAFSIIFCGVVGLITHNAVFSLLGGIAAVMQLLSFLPGYGDGNVIWNSHRRATA